MVSSDAIRLQPALIWRRRSPPVSAAAGTTYVWQLLPAAPSPLVPPYTGATAAAPSAAAAAAAAHTGREVRRLMLRPRLSTPQQTDRHMRRISKGGCTSRTHGGCSPISSLRSEGKRGSHCHFGRSQTRGTAADTTAPSLSTPQRWRSGNRLVGNSWQCAIRLSGHT